MLANGEGSWKPTVWGRSVKGFPVLYESVEGKGGRLLVIGGERTRERENRWVVMERDENDSTLCSAWLLF